MKRVNSYKIHSIILEKRLEKMVNVQQLIAIDVEGGKRNLPEHPFITVALVSSGYRTLYSKTLKKSNNFSYFTIFKSVKISP